MAKQTIGIGSAANDGTGDPLRSAFDKINDNFSEIYTELGGSSLSSLSLSGNALISDVTNSDINITPNGTGVVIINSNLEVKGTTTEINATTLEIGDNLIELNKDNSGGADEDAGIYIQRGSAGNNAVFYWNEGDDKFKAVLTTSVGTATAVTDSSTATIVANLEGDVTAGTVDTNIIQSTDSSNIRIQEAVEISGAVVGQSTANFTGAITSGGIVTGTALTVGAAVLTEAELETIDTITAGTVAASKAVVVDASKDITGFNNLTATGNITAKIGDFESLQSTDSSGVTINDNLVINGTIIAEGSSAVNIADGLNVAGAISGDSLDVNEISSTDSTAIQINDGINCSGTVSANALDTSQIFNSDSSAIKIDDALELAGELNHTGNVVHVTGITQLSRETVSGDSAGTDVISVATDVTFLDMSSGGQTLSIADGVDGQIKYIICNQVGTVAGGGGATPAILANTNGNWATAIRFDAVGESVTLIFDSQTGKWNIVGSNGATIS